MRMDAELDGNDAPLPDKSSRCWLCSAKNHKKNDCPTRKEDSPSKTPPVRGENGEGAKGGGKKGNGKGKAKTSNGSSSSVVKALYYKYKA